MLTIVGFLSRPHGFNVLTTLGKLDEFDILKIYTHKFNPRSQDSNRGIRSDYELFVNECEKFAEESPYPEKSLMYDAVYEQEDYPFLKHKL